MTLPPGEGDRWGGDGGGEEKGRGSPLSHLHLSIPSHITWVWPLPRPSRSLLPGAPSQL